MLKLSLTVLSSVVLTCVGQIAFGQTKVDVPKPAVQEALIKNTLTAVNHANLTANYTVLSDLSSQGLRSRCRVSDFVRSFANLRKRKIDMSPILCLKPKLTKRPTVDENGRLRLVGHFSTKPLALHYNLVYQHQATGWMLDDISIWTADGQTVGSRSHPKTPTTVAKNTARRPTQPTRRRSNRNIATSAGRTGNYRVPSR